jgi:phage gp36-like protein
MAYALYMDLPKYGIAGGALAGISTAIQTAAIGAASSLMDGYLASQFQLPLLVYGDDVKAVCCKLAVHELMRARGFNPANATDLALRQGYEDSIRWLEGVASGAVSPQVTDSSASAAAGHAEAPTVISSSQRGWTSRGTAGSGGGGFVGD